MADEGDCGDGGEAAAGGGGAAAQVWFEELAPAAESPLSSAALRDTPLGDFLTTRAQAPSPPAPALAARNLVSRYISRATAHIISSLAFPARPPPRDGGGC